MRDAFGVRLTVNEIERVSRNYFLVQLFTVVIVKYLLQPIVGAQTKVIIAVRANLERLFQFLLVEVLAAFFAADKDILSAHDAV